MLLAVLVTASLGGCQGKGSSAPPPTDLAATAGDGRVLITWTADPGVEYWLFTATDPRLTAFDWTGLPFAHAYLTVRPPFYVCGLFSGTQFYFAMNGRINGGPGGSSSPTISSTIPPYNASAGTWTLNPVSLIENIYGLGYTSLTTCSNNSFSASGSFVAVGANGAIFTSDITDGVTNGLNWNNRSLSGYLYNLNAVAGNAARQNDLTNPSLRWVVVGDGGASFYSLDGITWDVGNPYNAANPALRAITQVSGVFFTVGDSGEILSSTDGISWTSRTATSATTNNLHGINHGARYVAVGDNGTIVTSFDGINWSVQTPTPSIPSINLRQVTSSGSIFVAVGDAGTVVTSKDGGATWTAQSIGTSNLTGVTSEIQFVFPSFIDPELGFVSTAQFVAADSLGNTFTSVNGLTWSSGNSTNIGTLNTLVSSGFGYVAAGNSGTTASAF